MKDSDAAAVQRWADDLGMQRSALVREALRLHLDRLESKRDGDHWAMAPLDKGELALAGIANWSPGEDWSDWM